MRVVIRADASNTIGSGHVIRCLTLAETLRERGSTVSFVCREHPGHSCDLVTSRGFEAFRLPPPAADWTGEGLSATAKWLGAGSDDDAMQTREIVASLGTPVDWLLIDHYAIGKDWEEVLRPFVERIMVIDDLADRPHRCDALLNQNLVDVATKNQYADLVPPDCELFLGTAFALLQPRYAALHDEVPPRQGQIRRLFVYFGGADRMDLTGRVLRAWVRLGRGDIAADVVVAADHPNLPELRSFADAHASLRLHEKLATLADLMAASDLAVGAAGTTTWERCCLGLPSIVITMAENQRENAGLLDRRGVVQWLGDHNTVNEERITAALRALIESGLEPGWSIRCRDLVDGKGAARVAGALLADKDLRIRHASLLDADTLLEWRNDPETRSASRNHGVVTAAEHRAWLEAILVDRDARLFVAEYQGRPAGTVRTQRKANEIEVSWTVSPEFRGKGIGKAMVKRTVDNLSGDVVAEVRSGNDASRAIAGHAGLSRSGQDGDFLRFARGEG